MASFNPRAEDEVGRLLGPGTPLRACAWAYEVLGKVGTQKSVPLLEKLAQSGLTASAAKAALAESKS